MYIRWRNAADVTILFVGTLIYLAPGRDEASELCGVGESDTDYPQPSHTTHSLYAFDTHNTEN